MVDETSNSSETAVPGEPDHKFKMDPQDFQNYQRILQTYPATSFTVVGFFLTLNSAAVAAVYSILGSVHHYHKVLWLCALSFAMIFAIGLLYNIWKREHLAKEGALKALTLNGIPFPDTPPRWKGRVRTSIKMMFNIGFIFWGIAFALFLTRIRVGL